jgi:hypothetical protein
MSWNPSEMRPRAAGRRRLLAVFAYGIAAGLAMRGCDDGACTSPYDELTAFIEVHDGDGPCTECSAEDGLTIIAGLANGCERTEQFTTPSGCVARDFSLVKESGEMLSAGLACFPAVTTWELQPAEVVSSAREWGRGNDQLSSAWGPLEPGRYRLLLTMDTDLMTNSDVAPAIETEIVVTAQ